MRTLQIDKDKFRIPSAWNDFNAVQFLRIAELSLSQLPIAEFRLKVLLTCTGLTVDRKDEVFIEGEPCFYLKKEGESKYLLSAKELSEIAMNFDFLFTAHKQKDGSDVLLVDCYLYKQLIPEFKLKNIVFLGPDSGLTNITLSEWIHSETAYDKYARTRKKEYVDTLIAILYRKVDSSKTTGDKRIAFNDHTIADDANFIASLSPVTKNAIFLWYEGCRNFIVKKFPEVFSPKKKSKTTGADVFENFLYLVNALSNNDVTKTEQVRTSYLMEVMITLNAMAIEQREFEERRKK